MMFICLCNGVTEHDIQEEIEKGNNTIDLLASELNVGQICGSCQESVLQILEKSIIKSDSCKKNQNLLKFVQIIGYDPDDQRKVFKCTWNSGQ